MSPFRTRLRQGMAVLFRPRPKTELPQRWSGSIPDEVKAVWEQLPAYDQHHLVAVARCLEARRLDEPTVIAGLLHDIGKAGTIPLAARAAAVLLRPLTPGVAARIRDIERPQVGLKGLHLVLTHAERGANVLDTHGMDPRVVWLVRHHGDDLRDPSLTALRTADNRH